jgi:hypothetical protein
MLLKLYLQVKTYMITIKRVSILTAFLAIHVTTNSMNELQKNHNSQTIMCKFEGCSTPLSETKKLVHHMRAVHNMFSFYACPIGGCKELLFKKYAECKKHIHTHTHNTTPKPQRVFLSENDLKQLLEHQKKIVEQTQERKKQEEELRIQQDSELRFKALLLLTLTKQTQDAGLNKQQHLAVDQLQDTTFFAPLIEQRQLACYVQVYPHTNNQQRLSCYPLKSPTSNCTFLNSPQGKKFMDESN